MWLIIVREKDSIPQCRLHVLDLIFLVTASLYLAEVSLTVRVFPGFCNTYYLTQSASSALWMGASPLPGHPSIKFTSTHFEWKVRHWKSEDSLAQMHNEMLHKICTPLYSLVISVVFSTQYLLTIGQCTSSTYKLPVHLVAFCLCFHDLQRC